MSAVMICGELPSAVRLVKDVLVDAGLRPASAAFVDLRAGVPYSELLAADGAAFRSAVAPAGIDGRVLAAYEVESDLQDAWGWTTSANLAEVVAWQSARPDLRFVMVYTSLELSVADAFPDSSPPNRKLEEVVAVWWSFHSGLLRLHHQLGERSVLVNVLHAIHTPKLLAETVSREHQLSMGLGSSLAAPARVPSALAAYLSTVMVEDHVDAKALMAELDSSAHIDPRRHPVRRSELLRAHAEFLQLQAESQSMGAIELRLRTEVDLREAALDAERSRNQGLEQSLLECTTRHDQTAATHRRSLELQRLHVSQLELELDRLHTKAQALDSHGRQASAVAEVREVPARGFAVDLRNEVDGTNWYYAERDGRWAGPETSSRIRIPPLESGDYLLEFDVVDSMSRDILGNVRIEVNGMPCEVSAPIGSLCGRVSAKFSTNLLPQREGKWEIDILVPEVLAPRDRVDFDRPKPARGLKVFRLSRRPPTTTTAAAESDRRMLSLRVRSIAIWQIHQGARTV